MRSCSHLTVSPVSHRITRQRSERSGRFLSKTKGRPTREFCGRQKAKVSGLISELMVSRFVSSKASGARSMRQRTMNFMKIGSDRLRSTSIA